MVGRAVENILRLRIGRQDRGFVDLDLGIAEAITGAEIESADPPRERRSGVDRIEVGDITGVADEQAAVRALTVGPRARRERAGFEAEAARDFEPSEREAAARVRIAMSPVPAEAMHDTPVRRELG